MPDQEKILDFVEKRIQFGKEGERKLRDPRRKDSIRAAMGRKVMDEVFDRATLLTLWKLIHKNTIVTLDYPISTGKEANVFHATDPKGKSVAVKIFRVSNATFYAQKEYMSGDPRFKLGGTHRDLIYAWVRKEYKNLLRFHDGGIRVPAPITALGNVLCMEFVGEAGTPAPLLKDVEIEEPSEPYEEIIGWIRKAWSELRLVHGDLSEFNLLVHDNKLYLIDVGQAVLTRHPMATEFLLRDLTNVTRFFEKKGVAVQSPRTVWAEITKAAKEARA